MFRNDDPTAVASSPAVPATTGSTPGFFTNGNPGSGQPATIVPDWWLNQVQEELMAVLTKAGIPPSKGSNAQVLSSLQRLFGVTWARASQSPLLLPNGLIIQTFASPQVQLGAANTAIEYSFTFPQAFPNNLISISAIDGGNACISWGSFTNLTRAGGNGFVWSSAAGQSNSPAGAQITAIGY